MNRVVFLDTSVVVPMFKRPGKVAEPMPHGRCDMFVQELVKSKGVIMLPSISFGELAYSLSATRREGFAKEISRIFRVADYDLMAAMEFARIAPTYCKVRHAGKTRNALKADAMILATAVSRKASVLYTLDSDMIKNGGAFMSVMEPPPFPGLRPDQHHLSL